MAIAQYLAFIIAIASSVPPLFTPPSGWPAANTAGSPFDAIWMAPKFGKTHNEFLALTSYPLPRGRTLADEVRSAISELSDDGKTIVNSHAEPTCHGRQPGWTFDARTPLTPQLTVSQLYHVAVLGDRSYAFVFTHKAGDPIDPEITNSIQSLCASKQ